MRGIIVQDTLRANWKQTLYWGFGMGILGFYLVAISSSSDILESYVPLLESLPPAMLNMFGISDVRLFTTAEGWISAGFVIYAMLMLSVYAVMAGLNITANEEDSGIMDILLTSPLSRAQVIIEKFIAYAILSLGVIVFCILYPLIGVMIFNVEVNVGKVILSILTIYPGLLLIIAVTCLIGATVRRRSTAIGLATVFIITSYFANFLGESASESFAAILQQFSYFHYTNGEAVILDAFNPLTSLSLIIVAIICVGLSVMMFNRRDIGL